MALKLGVFLLVLCVASVLLPVACARRVNRELAAIQTAESVSKGPSCSKVVEELIRIETATAGDRRFEVCGKTQQVVFEVIFGKRGFSKYAHSMLANKFDNLPNEITTSLTTCDPGASIKHCACGRKEACHSKIKFNPSEFYLVTFEIDPDDEVVAAAKPKTNPGGWPLSHFAIVYINKDSSKAFIYHSFAGVHPMKIVETNPIEVLMAFNAIVGGGKPPSSGPILQALKKFDVDNEWYINAAKRVVVVGGFRKQDCRDAWADQDKLRDNICKALYTIADYDKAKGKCGI